MKTTRTTITAPANTVRTDARDLSKGDVFYIAGNPSPMVADKVTYISPKVRVDYHILGGDILSSIVTAGMSTMYVVPVS